MAFTFDTDVTLNSGKILQTNTVNLPTESGGSTYGTGSSGQVLTSNGSGVYWSGALHNESVYYGTCSTAAGTQQKDVTAANFPSALEAGQKLCVKFTNGQTYNGQPTLKVNSLSAKSICKFGTTAAVRYEWQAGQILCFMYDGTNWIIVDGALANGNYPGKVKLSDNYTSSGGAASAGVGASSKAVYDAYTALDGNKVGINSTALLAAIELSPGSSTAGHGGYIDFHFNGSSADYTSRIIENAAGNIDINGISITGLNQAVGNKQERFVLGSLTGTTSASGNLQLDVTDTNARVVCAWSDTGATCCIPYCETNGRWWVHCISDGSSYSVRGNTRLTIYYYYFIRAL